MKARLIVCILMAMAFVITGCMSTTPGKNSEKITSQVLEPQLKQKFGDIPIPAGFKLLVKESYSFESSGIRVGVLKYKGKADIEQVVSFYKDQMPLNKWNLINIVEYGQRLLNFDKDTESCIITLLPKGNSIILSITVGPKSQNQKKTDKPANK